MMHTMMVTQQANSSRAIREVNWLQDFKRFDPHPFIGSTRDPTEAQIYSTLWISSNETIFLSMERPDNHKVPCASYMLQKDEEVWWTNNKDSINPGGGVMTWDRFKEAFLKQYYPKEARFKRQQKFTNPTKCEHLVDRYDQEFMRLKRFAPSLIDTEKKMTKNLSWA